MPVSSTHTGWRRDDENSRLDYYYEGTRIGHIDANGFTVVTGKAFNADEALAGQQVANVANANTEGGIPLVYRINIAAVGATSLTADVDVTVVDKIRVLDVMVLKTAGTTGGGNENVTIKSTGAAITDVMSWTGVDKSIVRAATIDDAQHEIAAGKTLRVTIDTSITDETSDAGVAIITAIKVA